MLFPKKYLPHIGLWLCACIITIALLHSAVFTPSGSYQAAETQNTKVESNGEETSVFRVEKRAAWVTVATDVHNLRAILSLAHSLRRVDTEFDIVLLAKKTLEKHETMLYQLFDKIHYIIDIDITLKNAPEEPEESKSFWLKFHALNMVQYDVIGLIDHNTIFFKNVDRVMGCPCPCGVFDTKIFNTAKSLGAVTGSSFLVLAPDTNEFNNIIRFVENDVAHESLGNMRDSKEKEIGGWDQAVWNAYYGERMTNIAPYLGGIQLMPVLRKPDLWNPSVQVPLVHFMNDLKPWNIVDVKHTIIYDHWILRDIYIKAMEMVNDLIENGLSKEYKQLFYQFPPERTKYSHNLCQWHCKEIPQVIDTTDWRAVHNTSILLWIDHFENQLKEFREKRKIKKYENQKHVVEAQITDLELWKHYLENQKRTLESSMAD